MTTSDRGVDDGDVVAAENGARLVDAAADLETGILAGVVGARHLHDHRRRSTHQQIGRETGGPNSNFARCVDIHLFASLFQGPLAVLLTQPTESQLAYLGGMAVRLPFDERRSTPEVPPWIDRVCNGLLGRKITDGKINSAPAEAHTGRPVQRSISI